MAEKRLIWGDIAEEHLTKLAEYYKGSFSGDAFERAAQEIANMPTVDAVHHFHGIHGYWIDSYNTDHMGRIIEHGIDCSVCESVFKDDSREVVKRWKERFKVCPFCGAKMDGDGNEDV